MRTNLWGPPVNSLRGLTCGSWPKASQAGVWVSAHSVMPWAAAATSVPAHHTEGLEGGLLCPSTSPTSWTVTTIPLPLSELQVGLLSPLRVVTSAPWWLSCEAMF